MYRCVSKNTKGNDYVVGDIHGCFSLLSEALDKLGFDYATDRLFSVGDLVDRGPENERVLEFLKYPWFYAVRGNHDQFIAAEDEIGDMRGVHLMNGGAWYLGMPEAEQREYIDALQYLPIAMEVETDTGMVGIVHAEVPNDDWQWFKKCLTATDVNLEHIEHVCLWGRQRVQLAQHFGKPVPDIGGIDTVCVGHTVVKEAGAVGNVLYLDTGAVRSGVFSFACIQGGDAGAIYRIERET